MTFTFETGPEREWLLHTRQEKWRVECVLPEKAISTTRHTRGATTWVTTIVDGGKAYNVVFPDSAGFNPGYRLATSNPSYPGIADDYRRTHHFLEMLKPDIWLAQHNQYYDLEGKRKRARRSSRVQERRGALTGPNSSIALEKSLCVSGGEHAHLPLHERGCPRRLQ